MKIYKNLFLFVFISIFSTSFLSCFTCEHQYETIERVEATCQKIGYETLKCTLCNKKTTRAILSSGHDFEDILIIEEATCAVEGIKLHRCRYCNLEEEIAYLSDNHDFVETHYAATCTIEEYSLKECSICHIEIKEILSLSKGHLYGEWVTTIAAKIYQEGKQERSCDICGYTEEKILPSTIHINLEVLQTEVSDSLVNDCNSFSEAQLFFDKAIFKRMNNFKLACNFLYGTQKELFDTLIKNSSMNVNYHVTMKSLSTSSSSDAYIFTFDYGAAATLKASDEKAYTQYQSLNYSPYNSNRSNDFTSFKAIIDAKYSIDVEFTDQLVYILERGIIPNVKEGSSLEIVYEQIKTILREIIDDNMSDFEKLKAIHDYLILNVTYDAALLDLTYSGVTNLFDYRGFYLEGVFLDKQAVCDGLSKAFSVMCNLEGIPCVCIQGRSIDNPNGVGHAWNKVFLEGQWYIVDTTSDGVIFNSNFEVLSYEYFLVSSDKLNNKYKEQNYLELRCNSNYDTFKKIKINYNGKNDDCYAETYDELVSLIKAFESSNLKNSTIQFYVAFDYGTSIIDELQTAYASIGRPASFSHVINDNILTLIK